MAAGILTKNKQFQLILIKPSHYDKQGYVIQWLRSSIPSNTLSTLYGLATEAAQRRVLGPDVDIVLTALDETNTRITSKKVVDLINAHDGFGMVALVGVQSNQYPRALDIARPLREAGVQVVIGGFHVSGCLAMLPGIQPDLQKALDMGICLYAGEAENRLDEVLLDAAAKKLKPIYNYMKDLPSIEATPTPFLPASIVTRVAGNFTGFDAGRGCPFQCSFCTIINVQGRKSRHRSPDDIERIIRENAAQGIVRFFITDDNFARNKDWEAIFDRIILLRERDGIRCKFIIQVDTLCHRIPNFIEKAAKAGVKRVFIGLENINPDNLVGAKKRQNKITEYRTMLQAWKKVRTITYAGYILGFPNDTPESIVRDIKIIQRELPVDLLEFFCLTPLPGSEDHQTLFKKGVPMDPDLNKYDLDHVVTSHPKMSKEEWEGAYKLAWDTYYSPDHINTIMKRAAASGINSGNVLFLMLWFYGCITLEGVHPLEGGFWRRKYRLDRRPELPREGFVSFHLKRIADMAWKHWKIARMAARYTIMLKAIQRDPKKRDYTDLALTPVREDDDEQMEMLMQNASVRAAVEHRRKVEKLTVGARA